MSCSPPPPSALYLALLGHIKRLRGRVPFRTAHQHPPSIRDARMANNPTFLTRSLTVKDLIRACDPFSDEVAQAFLRSEVYDLFLRATALVDESV